MTPSRLPLFVLALVPACIFGSGDDDGDSGAISSPGDTVVGDGSGSDGSDGSGPGSNTDAVTSAQSEDTADDDASDASDDDDSSDDTTGNDTGSGLPSATAIAIAVGRLHSCAVTDAGGVRCWGYSNYGQLGNGAPLADVAFPEPVVAVGLQGITAISSFGDHTCALDDDGTAWCWGANDYGQLGDGTTTTSASPVAVVGGPFTAIDAGYAHTCAITQGGGAQCWGHNDYGQLGDDTIDDRSTPASVTGLGDATAISAGRDHTCAVDGGGTLRCWGGDTYGELGNGEPSSASRTPVVISVGGDGVATVASGDNDTCAITVGGAAWCWGKNADGQLGNGESGTLLQSSAPVAVIGMASGVTAIAPGFGYTCAVASGSTRCWGDNYNLVLGNGEGPGFESPTAVGVTGLDAGGFDVATAVSHTCGLDDAGAVRCWGTNEGGSIGDGSDDDAAEPVAVIGLP